MTELAKPARAGQAMVNAQLLSRRRLLGIGAGTVAASLVAACGQHPSTSSTQKVDLSVRESPMLTGRVKAGQIPALAERLPKNPMVQEVWKAPGAYGRTLRYAMDEALASTATYLYADYGLLEWNMHGTEGVPSLAESVEASENNSVYTITLRQGLKWSDGQPLTNEDVLFALNDVLLNKTLNPTLPTWFRNFDGTDPTSTEQGGKVVITFNSPNSLFLKYLYMPFNSYQAVKPKHYLKAFHPNYTDPNQLAAAAKKAGLDKWDNLYATKDNPWLNAELPTAGAYVLKTAATGSSGTASYERNPYYYKTDSHGRQLPYIDRATVQVLSDDTLNLRAAGGELDLQSNVLAFTNTGLLQRNADAKGYRVMRWLARSNYVNLFLNLSNKDATLRNLLQNIDFRAALSQAIDRDALNKQLLGGVGDYRQFTPSEGDPYYVDGVGQRFLKHDVAAANRLLDGLGLTRRDGNGTRLRPDGKPLDVVVMFVEATEIVKISDALNFVVNAWKDIGVKLTLKPVDTGLFYNLRDSNDYDILEYTGHSVDWDMQPIWFVPQGGTFSGPAFGAWFSSNGKSGMEPPQEFKDLWNLWGQLAQAPSDQARIAAGQQITKQWDEKVYVIGLIGTPFRPAIANKKLQNVRDDNQCPLVFMHGFDGVTKPEQLWFAS